MVIHTYIDKSNTIISNSSTNTGLNPINELFYGGQVNNNQYSRVLFHFDESNLVALYTGGTFTDLTKLKHVLRMTNTGAFDTDLLNGKTTDGKDRTTSFDLICFKIPQAWDSGVGYDYNITDLLNGSTSYSTYPSNWVYAQTGMNWSGGTGVYSGSPSGITVSTQHFNLGNENIEMDITDYVNGVLTGNTNYGLGIAYSQPFEQTNTSTLQYVGFFNNNTQTFYEPYIETIYNNTISDDRNDFYTDKKNKLYCYINIGGNPTNLDYTPSVTVYDQNNAVFSAYSSSAVTHVTKGVYSIDIIVPTNATNDCTMYYDTWTGVTINGVLRQPVELNFALKDSSQYYMIGGSNDIDFSNNIAISVSGIQNKERIKRGDIRKIVVNARYPFTVNQSQKISGLEYRLYVKEGMGQLTVIDYQPVELSTPNYYLLLDTNSLLPNTYYLDIKVSSNLEVLTKNEVISFDIINQVEYRKSQ